jgi:glycosyltransferase involved in cell wall biosynthesis
VTVSILIPAFRPDYLDLSIASALGQTFEDFELIISDDSAGTDVEAIVSKWSDERLRYVRNPNRGLPGANRDHLLSLANRKYVKFLHDDDFLFPETLERLTMAADRWAAAVAFTWWTVVDEMGRPGQSFQGVAPSEERLFPREEFFDRVIAKRANLIGGPSHVLIERAALGSFENPFDFVGFRMRFVTDIALYTNLIIRDFKFVGLGLYGSTYRVHAGSYGQQKGTALSAVFIEFELLYRWSVDHGYFSPGAYAEAMKTLHGDYHRWGDEYPELSRFIDLDGRPGPDGRYMSGEFIALVDEAHNLIDERLADRHRRGFGASSSHDGDRSNDRDEIARLEARLQEVETEAEASRHDLEMLRRTRTFRYSSWPRNFYAQLRRKAGLSSGVER